MVCSYYHGAKIFKARYRCTSTCTKNNNDISTRVALEHYTEYTMHVASIADEY